MSDQPPSWFTNFMKQIAGTDGSVEASSDSSKRPNDEQGPPPKIAKTSKDPLPPKAHGPPSHNEEDDEFDRRFGHLFNSNLDDNNNNDDDYDNSKDNDHDNDHYNDHDNVSINADDNNNVVVEDNDDSESIDGDLVDILEKVPNWETSPSIKKFIIKCVDRPLPKQMLEDLSKEYTPSELLQKYFVPPKMPPRLFKRISKMNNKNAVATERALYKAQEQQLTIAKPLISALIDLKPLGNAVSEAREKMSISLHGIFSVSLQISHARRSNIRFLFKEALADALFSHEPNHTSLFGGTDFPSQVEKAVKEAKLDISLSKAKLYKQPFLKPGFQGSNNAAKYFYQRSTSRQQPQRKPFHNYNNYKNNNNNRRNFNQKTRGSSNTTRR